MKFSQLNNFFIEASSVKTFVQINRMAFACSDVAAAAGLLVTSSPELQSVLKQEVLAVRSPPSVSALVVERRSLHALVPEFDLCVLHHVVERLQALHHPENSEHRLQRQPETSAC